MTRYSFQSRNRIYVKDYGFLPFAKNMGKITSKNLFCKCSPKLLDLTK